MEFSSVGGLAALDEEMRDMGNSVGERLKM